MPEEGIRMNKGVTLTIGAILAFGLIFTISDAAALYSLSDHIDKAEKIKNTKQVFDIKQVEGGSQIQSVFAIFTLDEFIGDECIITLNEEHLNKDNISKKFTCQANNAITLDKTGRDALQTKLNDEQFNIVVKSITRNNQVAVESDLIQLSIVYNEPTYFAKIENGIVTNVIVADVNFIQSMDGEWVQSKKGIRANEAGIGSTYDSINDVFISKNNDPLATLDANYQWVSPIIKSDPIVNSNSTNSTGVN